MKESQVDSNLDITSLNTSVSMADWDGVTGDNLVFIPQIGNLGLQVGMGLSQVLP